MAIKNNNIITGTAVLGKKIIFNPSEKLLSKILIVKIKYSINKIPTVNLSHLPPKKLLISKISKRGNLLSNLEIK